MMMTGERWSWIVMMIEPTMMMMMMVLEIAEEEGS